MAVATSTLIVAGVTAAAGAYSANQQAQAGKAAGAAGRASAYDAAMNAGAEAGTLRYEAEEARRVAQLNAQKTLADAREFRSSQQAFAAATGFTYDSGTMQDLQQQTDNLAAVDALAMLQDGGQKYVAGTEGAKNIIAGGTSNALAQIRQGDAQAGALRGQAIGTLISTAASTYGTYNKAGTTKAPQVSGMGVGDTFKWGRE